MGGRRLRKRRPRRLGATSGARIASLSLAAEAWIRRTATVVFPADRSSDIGRLVEVSVIAVGGQNLESQQQRLRYLVLAIEALEES